MGGFLDLFRAILGWWSSAPADSTTGPQCTLAIDHTTELTLTIDHQIELKLAIDHTTELIFAFDHNGCLCLCSC